jgi:hypothetical protein
MFRPSHLALSIVIAAGLTVGTGVSVQATPFSSAPPGKSALNPADQFKLVFDDLGNGTIFVGGSMIGTSLPGTFLDDPADPACPSACTPELTYLLPASEPIITGDVAVLDPTASVIADWLRFTDAAGDISGGVSGAGARMIFYFMAPFASNIGTQNFVVGPAQTISGGIATFDYQPAGVPYPTDNEYIGSQAVTPPPPVLPEPESLALLASGIAAMALAAGGYRRSSSPKS